MGVRFACHQCGKALNIKTSLAGKRGKCPDCGTRFRIPNSDQPFSIPLEDQALVDDQQALDEQSLDDAQEDALETVAALASVAQAGAVADTYQPPAADPHAADMHFDPLEDPHAQWYVRPPNGGRYGPADGPTVRQWIREGRVTRTTLLWRDGWPQWRDCDEIIPEAFANAPSDAEPKAANTPKPPPAAPESITSPIVDFAATQKTMSGSAARAKSTPSPEDYLGAKKRRRSRQRVTLISILVAIAVILVVALVVALAWPR